MFQSKDEWIKKRWYIYVMEYYLVIKKNEVLTLVTTWMDLESIEVSEIAWTERQMLYYFTYM